MTSLLSHRRGRGPNRFSLLVLLLATSGATTLGWTARASAADAEGSKARLPASWYIAPEDAPKALQERLDRQESIFQRPAGGVDDMVDLILDRTSSALEDGTEERTERLPFLSRDPRRKPWRMANLSLELGISGQGLIGVLFAKGELYTQLIWRKKKQFLRATESLSSVADAPKEPVQAAPTPATESARGEEGLGMVFEDGMSRAQLVSQVEPLAAAVAATGRVRDLGALRKNLLAAAENFQGMTDGLTEMQGLSSWYPSRLRFDIEVNASGTVHPGVAVGGDVKLRFDWFPRKGKKAPRPRTRMSDALKDATAQGQGAGQTGPLRDGFRRLVWAIADEMGKAIPENPPQPGNLQLQQVLMSLGLTANGSIGVAKIGGTALGVIYFDRAKPQATERALSSAELASFEGLDAIPFIEKDVAPSHVSYAASHGIRHERAFDGNESLSIFHIKRPDFGTGMARALRIGTWMVERAERRGARHPERKWEVGTLKTRFLIALGGTAVVVTVAGQGYVELVFNRV